MKHTYEKAIGGRVSGQIQLGETVKWRARHFGLIFTMTIKIKELIRPVHFVDEMIKGPFKRLRHEHMFEKTADGTLMTDFFVFQSPIGILGKYTDSILLKDYLRKLLEKRNELIKNIAEKNTGAP
jgi:ligand-binding SRPBCC domain-containing protein